MLGPLREGAPRQIGPYDVLARLGAGGMGEVFLGRAPGDGSFVAVKTVRRDVANEPAFRDRFRREIKVAGMVRSTYAAAPVGGDADAEVPWLATAYVPGPSLSQAVRRGGPLPVATVRELGAGIARALADLHAAGVLHRDLKPGNVMLSVDGPRLIDFGIARSKGATTMTATGMMVGTPSFMSPEHVTGARHVTGASDVFCLGSLLCYAATGEDPFGDGPVAAVLYRVSQAEADLSRVPDELRDVVAACLSADPAARPAPERLVSLLAGDSGGERRPAWPESVREHIGEYGRELAQLVAAGGPLVEMPATPPEAPGVHQLPTMPPVAPVTPVTPAPPRKRRRGLIAAVVALAVVGGGLGTYLLWPQEGRKQTPGAAAPPASGPRIPGVDDRGLADASGVVPQNAAQRPAGWKPWRAELTAPAFGCSAGESVLVCRTTDGRYEALDTASGRKLWDADLVEDERDDLSYVGPTGGVFIAGDTARPVVHDTVAVLASGDRLQVRDARSGTVRWEKEAWGAQGVSSRPIVADGIVFAATKTTQDPTTTRVGMTAFSLADGARLWSKELTNAAIPRVEIRDFDPVAYAKGTVYALSDGGLLAYEAKTGTLLGQADKDAESCETLRVLGAAAYCVTVPYTADEEQRLHLLDAGTLASKGSLPAPVRRLRPDVISAKAVIGFDRGLKIHDPKDGNQLGSYAAKAAPAGLEQDWSGPLLAGDQVVYADYSALYTVRLGRNGGPAGLKVTPVPGAPGPRAAKEAAMETPFADMIRAPEVLPIGGIAHIVYDQGVVSSVELPK
ncbi:protein kinase domain-containing protein [Streptomyces vilmorinianum]|uniref:serine/threonine-protein kinase n=1 Tax=Streptomyces vilmorinianum TaxID=3051092 RepID=UPI0020C758D9|nr:serine/threonine-protein kinase [Streptomyces vilmorinianum]